MNTETQNLLAMPQQRYHSVAHLVLSLLLAIGLCGWLIFPAAYSAEDSTKASGSESNTAWKNLRIPKAWVAVGVWGEMFHWREALQAAGIEYDEAYRAQNAYHRPLVQMVNMPSKLEDYRGYSTIVLINVDAPALGEERLAAIKEFVAEGGGLVVLGGYWAYGRGAYAKTPLEELLPVELVPEGDIPQNRAGFLLAPSASADWKWNADFAAKPKAFYVHALPAKPSANTILIADDKPALVTGLFGQGRVVACMLTVNGKTPEKTLAFWDWKDWPAVLGQTVEWAGANRPLSSQSVNQKAVTGLDEEEAEKLRLGFQPLTKKEIARFVAQPQAAAADAIFALLFPENKSGIELTPALVEALASQAQAEWRPTLEKTADSLNPNLAQRRVALELLGATKIPETSRQLLAALDDPDMALGAIAGLERLGDPQHRGALERVYARSLPRADFRNYDLIDEIVRGPAEVQGQIAVRGALALYHLGDPEGVSRILELHKELRLLRRVFFNAAKRRVVETDPVGVALRAAIWTKAVDFQALERQLLAHAGPVPESQQSAFHTVANSATAEEDVFWLAAALHQSPSTNWSGLSSASSGILRRLATSPVAQP